MIVNYVKRCIYFTYCCYREREREIAAPTENIMIQEGYLADIIAVEGNPVQDISRMRRVKFVMKDGSIYKNE